MCSNVRAGQSTNEEQGAGHMFKDDLVDLYPRLLKYARRIAKNGADAEDLVHDAIERGLLRRHLFHEGRLEYWISTILRHLFLDSCRRRHSWRGICVQLARLQHAEGEAGGGSVGTDSTDHSANAIRRRYDTDDVRRAMNGLTPRLREVFSLFVFDRLTQREIGRRLSLPISTVGTRLLRARRRLRILMEMAGPQGLDGGEPPTDGQQAYTAPASEHSITPAAPSRRATPSGSSWSNDGRMTKIAQQSCSPP